MNDPDSYEHLETRKIYRAFNHIIVVTKFRGKNAFGKKVVNEVHAKISLRGEIIGTSGIEERPVFER